MLRTLKVVLINALAVMICGSFCLGQAAKESKTDPKLAAQKNEVIGAVKRGTFDAAKVEPFLKDVYLARWKKLENASELHLYRAELVADIDAMPDSSKSKFMDLAARHLTIISADKTVYPACRYNAVLAIAEMNSKPASGNTAAVPYSGVLKRLYQFCDSDKIVLPDYVRLAALVGIVRHTELGIQDADNRKMVHQLFLKMLSPEYGQQKRYRAEVMSWFEIKAMEGLNNMRTPAGPKGATETLDAFRGIIESKKSKLDVKCLAARGIAVMDLTKLKDYDMDALAKSVAMLIYDFCQEDLTFIEEQAIRDQIKSGSTSGVGGGMDAGMSGGMDPGMGGGMGGPQGGMDPSMMMDPMMAMGGGAAGAFVAPTDELTIGKIRNIIARVKFDFDSVVQAINGVGEKRGVKAALPPKQKDTLDLLNAVVAEVKKTYDFLDNGPAGPAGPAAAGGKKARGRKKTADKGDTLKVDIPLIKDHLKEQLIRYKELLGVDAS